MRLGVAVVVVATLSALSACKNLDSMFPGFDIGAPKREPIKLADSKVGFLGDPDPIVTREATTYKDRYTEWLVAENGVKLRYSKLAKGGLNPRLSAADALAADAKTDYFDDEGIIFDRANVQRRGQVVYLVGRSKTKTCFIFRSHFGDVKDAPPGSPGNQELIGQDCQSTAPNSAEVLQREAFSVVDRARFDDGAINRARAIAGNTAPPAAALAPAAPALAPAAPALAPLAPAAPAPPAAAIAPSVTPQAQPAPAAMPVPPEAPSRNPADRLRTLRDLLDQKLISPSEYEKRRKAILDSI
jgi:hypothetical protein